MGRDDLDVEAAYALSSPDDSRALYAKWAKTYDADFAERQEFLMPGHVARIFHEMGGTGPVLDAGAGTGLVGQALAARGAFEVDALDITPEMLEVAAAKRVYRDTIEANLLETLPIEDASYAGVVSSGTFTHGHVGPEALDELLRVARPGALFVLTIKKEHFEERGFAGKFAEQAGAIRDFETRLMPIYGAGADAAHRDDEGLIVIYRKG